LALLSREAYSVSKRAIRQPKGATQRIKKHLPKRVLEQFIRDQARHLKNTTLVMVDCVHISNLYLAEVDQSIEKKPHSVEYIRGTDGETEIELEHVDAEEAEETVQPRAASPRASKHVEQAEDVIA
jgi:hypothetical protein